MSTRQASTGLRRSERLSKKKKSTNRKSTAPPSEPTKEPEDSKVQQKDPEQTNSQEERDELIKEHEKMHKLRNQYRSQTRKVKSELKELLKKDIPNGPAGERLRRVLANRHRVKEAVRNYKYRAARCDKLIMEWAEAIEEQHVEILADIEKANNNIANEGPWSLIKPLDLSGAPESQDATTKTQE